MRVTALGALCELDDRGASRREASFRVGEFVELDDGSRVVLHRERGFTSTLSWDADWFALHAREAIERAVLTTVLPDDDDGEEHPWEWLAALCATRGIVTTAAALRRVPYRIEFGDEVLARLARRRGALHVSFGLRGVDFDPHAITAATGLQPATVALRGEPKRASAGAYERSSWSWSSRDWPDDDLEPLITETFALLAPHEPIFAAAVSQGAEAWMTVSGVVYASVSTADDADRRGPRAEEPFEPFIDAPRIWPWLEPDQLQFLARLHASFGTHIDIELLPPLQERAR